MKDTPTIGHYASHKSESKLERDLKKLMAMPVGRISGRSPWISVKDRMPEKSGAASKIQHYDRSDAVLVWDEEAAEYCRRNELPISDAIRRGFFLMGIFNVWRIEGQNQEARITYWRPLPEPPN